MKMILRMVIISMCLEGRFGRGMREYKYGQFVHHRQWINSMDTALDNRHACVVYSSVLSEKRHVLFCFLFRICPSSSVASSELWREMHGVRSEDSTI